MKSEPIRISRMVRHALLAAVGLFAFLPFQHAVAAQEIPCTDPRAKQTVFVSAAQMSLSSLCRERRFRRHLAADATTEDPVAISGHVTHQNGVRMSGVTMTLTDHDLGTARTVITDQTGNYMFDEVPWGHEVELVPTRDEYEFYPPAIIWAGIVEDAVENFIAVGPPPPPPTPPANQPILAWTSYFDNSPNLADFNGILGRDAQGNVYTAGTSYLEDDPSGNTDIVLFKTDPNGNRIWSRTFNGPGEYRDGVRDLAVDAAGNSYITGFSYSLPEGPNELRSYNYVTLKYNADGDLVWTRFYGPNAGYDDFPRVIKLDPAGNILVAGYSWGINTYANYATVKYDADGNEVWASRFAGGYGEILNDLETDPVGNVYITGYSNSSMAGGSEDVVTIKYNAAGGQQWLNRYNSGASESDEGFEIEIDAAGDVLVLGQTYNFETSTPFIHKISGNTGATAWTRPIDSISPDQYEYPATIKLDAEGKIIIGGMLYDDVSYNVDAFVAKLTPEITLEWARTYDGPSDEDFDGDPVVALDSARNVYLAVTSEGFANADIQVVKYTSEGVEDWTYRFGNPFFGDDVLLSWEAEAAQRTMQLDSEGNLYIAGSSYIPEQSTDLVIFKLEPVAQRRAVPFDVDGDRKADISVFRPETGTWHYLRSSDGGYFAISWGSADDVVVPADYDGDGRADPAVFRRGTWYVLLSSSDRGITTQFGLDGDRPVPADFDNDGKADLGVFREGIWYSEDSSTKAWRTIPFGVPGDIPVPSDYDSNRRSDVAVFRNGTWYTHYEASLPMATAAFGIASDKPVPADYDGDRMTDRAVFRTGTWYIWESRTGSLRAVQFGIANDVPVPADYDGDGMTDIAVYRSGIWHILRSSNNSYMAVPFGVATDVPLPSAYAR